MTKLHKGIDYMPITIIMKADEFKNIRANLTEEETLILKFGAKWCKPCQHIKPFIESIVKKLPSNVKYYEIDIDESVELYLAFKSKKMIKGVPTLLSFSGNSDNEGLIPDDIVSGTDEASILNLFENI